MPADPLILAFKRRQAARSEQERTDALSEIEKLLKDGADPNALERGVEGHSLVYLAVVDDDLELLRVLLDQSNPVRADPNFPGIGEFIDSKRTPLHVVGYRHQFGIPAETSKAMVDLFVRAGADINQRSKRGRTMLAEADAPGCGCGQVHKHGDFVPWLISIGATK